MASRLNGDAFLRTGEHCGGAFIDNEFFNFLTRKVGDSAMTLLKNQNYDQLQYLIKEFCRVKWVFTGIKEDYKSFELDLESICPALIQYITGAIKAELEYNEWVIELDFETVKSFFDPIIGKILRSIWDHLNCNKDCSVMFLVGEFSESKYLQRRIKEEFSMQFKYICIPPSPSLAIVRW